MKLKHLSLFFLIGAVVLSACSISVVEGSGHIITENRSISDFHAVKLSAFGDLTITQGTSESLTVQADDNLMKLIRTEVVNGVLEISFDNNTWTTYYMSGESIKFDLTVVNLDSISFAGAGKITVTNLNVPELSTSLTGAGSMSLSHLTAEKLAVQLSGAGSLNADGTVSTQEINLSGVGSYSAADLKSTDASVSLSGVGSATVWVTDTLDITVSGAGSVGYYGEPQITKNVTGLGSLVNKGTK
jgi:hypothetical protein